MTRHKALLAWCLLVLCAPAMAQDVRGLWSGTLHTDNDHRVVLRIVGLTADHLRSTLYLDARGTDLPVDTVTFDNDRLDLSAIHGQLRFQAALDRATNRLKGTFFQTSPHTLELRRVTEREAWAADASPHTITTVEAEKGVSLEALDWGGNGPPALLLTGLGNNAHIFDTFAPKLTQNFHVYALTRRGAGASTWPVPEDENYTATRLGEDVIAAMRALRLDRPLVIGHSIAGEELSYLGTMHPELIRGLVYLDAAYAYAYFDEARPDFTISLNDLRRKLAAVRVAVPPQQISGTMSELADHDLPRFEPLLKAQVEKIATMPKSTSPPVPPQPPSAFEAIINGEQKFAAPQCPVLAIFALGEDSARSSQFADAFAAAAPQAQVMRLTNAKHYVFLTNELQVLGAIGTFARTRNSPR